MLPVFDLREDAVGPCSAINGRGCFAALDFAVRHSDGVEVGRWEHRRASMDAWRVDRSKDVTVGWEGFWTVFTDVAPDGRLGFGERGRWDACHVTRGPHEKELGNAVACG